MSKNKKLLIKKTIKGKKKMPMNPKTPKPMMPADSYGSMAQSVANGFVGAAGPVVQK